VYWFVLTFLLLVPPLADLSSLAVLQIRFIGTSTSADTRPPPSSEAPPLFRRPFPPPACFPSCSVSLRTLVSFAITHPLYMA